MVVKIKQKEKGERFYRQTIVEEHITFAQHQEGNYIIHKIQASDAAQNITTKVVQFPAKMEIETQWFVCMLHDNEAIFLFDIS